MTDKPATTETPAAVAPPPPPTAEGDAPGAAASGAAAHDGDTPSGPAADDQLGPAQAEASAPTPAAQPQPPPQPKAPSQSQAPSQPAEPPVPRGPRRSEPMDLAVIVAAMAAMVALGAGLATGSVLVGLVVLVAGGLLAVAVHRISTRAFRSAQ